MQNYEIYFKLHRFGYKKCPLSANYIISDVICLGLGVLEGRLWKNYSLFLLNVG